MNISDYQQQVICKPTILELERDSSQEQLFILYSDGLVDDLSHKDILSVFVPRYSEWPQSPQDLTMRSDEAVARAVELGAEASGDNVSVIALLLKPIGTPLPRSSSLIEQEPCKRGREVVGEDVEVESVLSDVDLS